MSEENSTEATGREEDERAKRKAKGERYTQIMWSYVCGAITLLCNAVGLEASFIPLGFGVLGLILCWQLLQKGERRHSAIAGAINLGGILIWLTYNWSRLGHMFGG
jgi:hypothetical protein